MQGAARALGWELFRRYRLGLTILGVYLLAFWTLKLAFAPDAAIRLDPPNHLAGLVIVPLAIAFMFFVAIFSYGLAGDLAGVESGFPRRMFSLPVSTRALAGWPMVYGTLASISLWFFTVALARTIGHVDVAIAWLWPA